MFNATMMILVLPCQYIEGSQLPLGTTLKAAMPAISVQIYSLQPLQARDAIAVNTLAL